MIRLNAKSRIAMGQIGLLSSLLLFAGFLGLVPDQRDSIRQGRTALAEVLAANSSALYKQQDIHRIHWNLELSVERNEELLSAALRKVSQRVVVSVGSHEDNWTLKEGDHSTNDQIRIPIWQNNSIWGHIELRFHPLVPEGWISLFHDPLLRLVAFISLTGFIIFYLYLGRMLKELNPSTAIPGRVRSALDTIAEALLIVDDKGNVVLANEAFSRLTGKDSDQLIGVDAQSLTWTSFSSSSKNVWSDAMHTAESTRYEKVGFTDSTGKLRTFIVNCSPVLGAGNKANGVLISMDDVTVLQEQEVQLRESMEIADQANQAKSAFLSNMSHEIRTPMTAILGFTEVLKRGSKNNEAERQKYLQIISSSGQHLLELINDLLDLSKVESGAMEVERLPCDFAAIVSEVIQVLRVKAQEKSIALDFSVLSDVPETIIGDPSRLRQVVTNLVGNAIKFTSSGKVMVEIILGDESEDKQRNLEIRIVDSGIGMSPAQQATIFDAFTQADASIARRFGGTGLGLSISRQLTLAMGGTLTVHSEEGVGSTFTISLPLPSPLGTLKTPDQIHAALNTHQLDEKVVWDIPASKILVVDDGPENRQLLSIVLSDLNADITLAENGQEALDAVTSHSFDVVLMDIQMPIMDGFESSEAMREQGISVPVIALTANAMKGFEERILASGFSHYLTKPVDIDKLTSLLGKLLGGTRRVVEASQAQGGTAGSDDMMVSMISSVDPTAPLVSDLLINDDRYIPVVEEFRERLGVRLEEMRRCVSRNKWKELDELGHWLKGSAGMIGMQALAEPAVLLQSAANASDENAAHALIKQIDMLQRRIVTDRAEFTHGNSTPLVSNIMGGDQRHGEPVQSTLPLHDPEYRGLVEMFIQRLTEQMVTLQAAVKAGDFAVIAEWAHWLRGSASNMGFAGFVPVANALELSAKQESESILAQVTEVERYAARVYSGWTESRHS